MSIAILLALASPALAQSTDTTDTGASTATGGFDAHGFRLSSLDADPRDPLRMQRPGAMEAGSWYAGALGEYASQPLVFQPESSTALSPVLSDVVAANLVAGVVAAEQVRFDLYVPVYLASNGPAGSQGAGLGDVRLSSLVAFMQPNSVRDYGMGLVAALDVPTGSSDNFLGEAGVGGLLALNGTYEADALTLTSQVGGRLAPNNSSDELPAPTKGGDVIQAGGGIGYLVTSNTGVTLEADVSVPVSATVRTAIGVPAEATLSVRHVRPQGAHITGGVGVGLGRGAGASPIRLLIGGGFGSAAVTPSDVDGDGIVDRNDACVSQPETVNGFADEDGCPDTPPAITFTASLDGVVQEDAVVSINGDAPMKTPRDAAGSPGAPLMAVAMAGDCLRGSKDLTFSEISASVDIPLTLIESSVDVSVMSEAGDLLHGAEVRYIIDDSRCLTDDRAVPQGKAKHTVGPGEYMVFVSVQGYSMHRQSFTLAAGDTAVVEAKLKPTKVQLEDGKLTILEKVFFETGKAVIEGRSFGLLDEVASTLMTAPIEGKVQVQGHTDGEGGESSNLKLSQSRAESVVTYLVSKGVSADMMEAKGFGESKPIADNGTEVGRTANRRVEFIILGADE